MLYHLGIYVEFQLLKIISTKCFFSILIFLYRESYVLNIIFIGDEDICMRALIVKMMMIILRLNLAVL